MKKKYSVSSKDKKDWYDFTKEIDNISIKEEDLPEEENHITTVRKLDLHGSSLNESNKILKKFIIESYEKNYKKLLIVTGKGKRSKSYDNPYISKDLSILKNSVPEFIKSNQNLMKMIKSIEGAKIEDGGSGAFYIYLKNKF